MKVSVNWLKEYTDIDLSIDELVAKIGAQLGAVEEVIDLGKKYQGIVVAKVVSCTKHPNADKLKICRIDTGKEEVQVVCGAPNVAAGMMVAWLPPGSTVPATYDKDPLVLEAREIRGQLSNGMLASASELAISDDHSGILEIDHKDAKPGEDFAKLYGLDDYIIDIENKMFTHRPDLFGILGIAREVAGIQQKEFVSPAWYIGEKTTAEHDHDKHLLLVKNELPDLVPRFMAQVIQDVTVAPSPLWLQIALTRVGLKPISNVVDITNYVMYLTGQPLHAFDYDKVKNRSKSEATIVVRHPKPGEKIKLLNGKDIEPRSEAIMIATDKELIALGGIMGGSETEVDKNTKNIILECANFDMYSIRRTSMAHGLFTDAVTRFNKGQSPLQNDRALDYAVAILQKFEIGAVESGVIDIKSNIKKPIAVHATAKFINERLGLDLTIKNITKLLQNVEFEVAINGPNIVVTPPFWRTDIEIPEDIVEEVGRLYGYDHLPMDLPKRVIVPVRPDGLLTLKQQLRAKLAKAGANEVLTYSFVHSNLLDKAGQDKKLAFKLTNALSPDLQYYRLSLTPSVLDKVHMNIKAGHDEFALFEIGKTHAKSELDEEGLPREFERLALVYASKAAGSGAAYYHARAYLDQLTNQELVPFNKNLLKDYPMLRQMAAPYDEHRSALVWNGKMPVGIVGEFSPEVKAKLKLPDFAAGLEIFLNPLLYHPPTTYSPLARYPATVQDISLKTAMDIPFAVITDGLEAALQQNSADDIETTTTCIDIFSNDSATKHTTFRVTATSQERTLTAEFVNSLLDKATGALKKTIDVERI